MVIKKEKFQDKNEKSVFILENAENNKEKLFYFFYFEK